MVKKSQKIFLVFSDKDFLDWPSPPPPFLYFPLAPEESSSSSICVPELKMGNPIITLVVRLDLVIPVCVHADVF